MADLEEFIKEVQAGRKARDDLYRVTRDSVLPTLEHLIPAELRPRWDPEDLLHEAFLRAVESLGRFEWRGEASWRSFILTIAKHCIQDALKRKSRADVRFTHESGHGGIRASWLPDPAPRTSDVVSRRETVETVLARMQEGDANLIRLKVIEGLPDEEVALRTGKSIEATRKAIQRARARFAETGRCLWPEGLPDEEGESPP
jgi:RNA polymerase sigma factor (sigma-70 family)